MGKYGVLSRVFESYLFSSLFPMVRQPMGTLWLHHPLLSFSCLPVFTREILALLQGSHSLSFSCSPAQIKVRRSDRLE